MPFTRLGYVIAILVFVVSLCNFTIAMMIATVVLENVTVTDPRHQRSQRARLSTETSIRCSSASHLEIRYALRAPRTTYATPLHAALDSRTNTGRLYREGSHDGRGAPQSLAYVYSPSRRDGSMR
jgi:hypothetical protein